MSIVLTSRLTSKGQTTIPANVRAQLDLHPGDTVLFVVRGPEVILQKLQGVDRAYLSAVEGTLTEWSSPEDEEAYRDL